MTPIEKNIFVVDEFGKKYEATYPKRAKGLVKNGRARFISSDTICLACPPDTNLEDKTMNDHINENIPQEQGGRKFNIDYILGQIEKILSQTDYIYKAIDQIGQIPSGECPDDTAGAEKAEGLARIVMCKETTNQQLIRLFETMYNDLKQGKQQQ